MLASEYVLRLISFEAGINVYTGTVQGGHTYATIIPKPDGVEVQLQCKVTEEYLAHLEALGDSCGYSVGGLPSPRFRSREDAVAAAVEWMKAHAPDAVLFSFHDWMAGDESDPVYDGRRHG